MGGGRPAVIYNAARDEFLVVYDRSYESSAENGIFAQRIGADGTLLGSELPLFFGTAQRLPRIAHDSLNDRYLVVWTGGAGLFGLVLNGDGQAITAVTSYGGAGAANPALAYSANSDSYLLAYEVATATATTVMGITIQDDGVAARVPFAIGSGTERQSTPFISFDSTRKRFLVVWTDWRGSATAPALFAQLLAENGAPVGTNIKLADSTLSPRIVYSPSSERYLLTWQIADSQAAKFGYLLGQILLPNLKPSGGRFTLSDAAGLGRPSLAADPSSSRGFLVWAGMSTANMSVILGQSISITDPAPRVSMTMAASPAIAKTDETITFTLRIENSGRSAARSATLRDKLPAGLRFVSATADQGKCALRGNSLRCSLGHISAGKSREVILTTVATDFGTITNAATLSWNAGGSAILTKSAKTSITVKYPGELAVFAPQSGELIPAGTAYQINWQVKGGDPADQLSFHLQYSLNNGLSWTTMGEGITGATYDWQVVTPSRSRKALIRVAGFVNGRRFGSALSGPFRVEVSR